MSPKRVYLIMLGVNSLLMLCILGGVYFGGVLIHKQGQKLVAAKTQSKVYEQQQVQLAQAKQDIETYKDLDQITKSIVPQDKDQAKTVREISKIAEESNITLKGISFSTSNLGDLPPAASSGSTQSSGTSSQSNSTLPTITQVTPVPGITGVYALPIIVNSSDTNPVSFDSLISFLTKLESSRRTANVDNITIKPVKEGDSLSFSINLNAYVKP